MVHYLRTPQRQLFVSVLIRLEDGSLKVYTGYRVIHNGQMGPAKGGIACDAKGLTDAQLETCSLTQTGSDNERDTPGESTGDRQTASQWSSSK